MGYAHSRLMLQGHLVSVLAEFGQVEFTDRVMHPEPAHILDESCKASQHASLRGPVHNALLPRSLSTLLQSQHAPAVSAHPCSLSTLLQSQHTLAVSADSWPDLTPALSPPQPVNNSHFEHKRGVGASSSMLNVCTQAQSMLTGSCLSDTDSADCDRLTIHTVRTHDCVDL